MNVKETVYFYAAEFDGVCRKLIACFDECFRPALKLTVDAAVCHTVASGYAGGADAASTGLAFQND